MNESDPEKSKDANEEINIYPTGVLVDIRSQTCCCKIETSGGTGTAFTINYKEHFFLVTARHIVNSVRNGEVAYFKTFGGKQSFIIDRIDFCRKGSDSAIILPDFLIRYGFHPLKSHYLNQQIAYCGFPLKFDEYTEPSSEDSSRPLPTIKSGAISQVVHEPSQYSSEIVQNVLAETIVNQGFSGGPVLVNIGRPMGKPDIRVIGVVSGYKYDYPVPILVRQSDGTMVPSDVYFMRPNSGFMIFAPIRNVLSIADEWIAMPD